MNVEIKPEYKSTEAGVIPEDWSCPCLGQLVHSVEYGSSAKSSLAGKIPVLRMGNLQEGKIDWNDLVFTDDDQEISKYLLNSGDVLFNRTNTPDLVGKTSIYRGETPAIFAGYLIRIKERKDLLNSTYLNYVLNAEFSKKYSQKILSVAVSQANINGQKLKTYPIPLPASLVEQEAISSALMDADALIGGMEKLIGKKRDIKQAVIQQLLTGQRRLPGFSDEWVVVKAGDVGRFRGGSGFPTRYQGEKSGLYPFYKVSDMNNAGNEIFMRSANNYVDEARRKLMAAPTFPAGSIIFAKVGAAIFLERKKILSRESCLDNNMTAYILDSARAHTGFIYYSFLNMTLGDLVSTTALPSLSGRTLSAIEFNLPSLAEQTAIAIILTNLDSELTTLETRRDKARQLKQGMMQELLTGRIRLSQSSLEEKLC